MCIRDRHGVLYSNVMNMEMIVVIAEQVEIHIVYVMVMAAVMAAVLCLVGLAVVYRKGTMRSVMPVQILAFSMMFMSTGQVPLDFMDGWLFHVARLNPATSVLRFARQGFIGDITWSVTWPGLVAMTVMVSATVVAAVTSMTKLSR